MTKTKTLGQILDYYHVLLSLAINDVNEGYLFIAYEQCYEKSQKYTKRTLLMKDVG